jgi:hypothetical protein
MRLERDDFSSNCHHALTYSWSMIFFRKPVSTFRDHALAAYVARAPGQAAAAAAAPAGHDANTNAASAPATAGTAACRAATGSAATCRATARGATARASATSATACSAAAPAAASAAPAAAAASARQLRAERLGSQRLLVEYVEGGQADVGDLFLRQSEYGNRRSSLRRRIRRRCNGRRSAPGHRQRHAGGTPCR